MGCLESKESEKAERLYYLAKEQTEIENLKRIEAEKEVNISTPSVKENVYKEEAEDAESDSEVIFSDTEDDIKGFEMKNLSKVCARIRVPEDITPEDYERKIYRYFTRHPHFGKFPSLEILRDAQEWYRSGNIVPPNDRFNIPVPHPTETSKTEFLELKEFYTIDEYAINTPNTFLKEDLGKLTEYLVESTTDELEQVRVIFIWITSHTIFPKDSKRKSYPPNTVGAFLMDIKQRHLGRDQFFCNMCECTGIKAVVVKGLVKGVNFNAFEHKAGRSSWSAVLVNKSWRLIDVGWASSYLTGTTDNRLSGADSWAAPSTSQFMQKKQYNFRDFYFFCDPEEFVYTHFPDERKWQLLARTVTEKEWFQLIEIKDSFFKLGLKLTNDRKCIEECTGGLSSVHIQYPKEQSCNFNYQFLIGQSDSSYVTSPEEFVYMENLRSKHVLNINIKLPMKGRYKLSIFGGDQYMPQLCTLYFVSYTLNENIIPFPKFECKEWGANSNMRSHGLSPLTHEGGTIIAHDGEAEIRFKMDYDLDFSYKFIENSDENLGLENCILHRTEKLEAIFTLRVPDRVEYTLSIYCRQKSANIHARYRYVAHYLICVTGSILPLYLFPPIPDGYLGPLKDFSTLGLKKLDKNPSFLCFPEKGEVEFLFQYTGDMSFQYQLILAGEKPKTMSEYVMMDQDISSLRMRCLVRAPTQGLYSLTILGNTTSSDNVKLLYSALLQSFIPSKLYSPFVLKFSNQISCKLKKPLSKNLVENTKTVVELECADAQEVATVGSYEEWTRSFEEWTPFVTKKNDIWQGTVVAPEGDFELELVATTEKGSNKFLTLYKYMTISKESHARADAEQKERIKTAKENVATLIKAGKLRHNAATGEIQRIYETGDLQRLEDIRKPVSKEENLKSQRQNWLRLVSFTASRKKITRAIQEYKKCYPKEKPEELLLAEDTLNILKSRAAT